MPPGDGHGEVCEAIRHGSLMGARGNSGVILSQILRGLADTFAPLESISATDVATGLRTRRRRRLPGGAAPGRGHHPHRRALGGRVGRAGGRRGRVHAERRCSNGPPRRHATRWPARPSCCRCSREAGVVDAGGRGFELLLASWLNVVSGTPVPDPQVVNTPAAVDAHMQHRHDELEGGRYEVMFLLHADDANVPAFKNTWDSLGDSIVVVGGEGLWNCHVHTDEIGAAIEAGIAAGTPARIQVTDLVEQVAHLEQEQWVHRPGGAVAGARHHCGRRGRGGRWSAPSPRHARRAAGGGRRSVDEPVDRADPRRRRRVQRRGRDRAAEQQEHRAGRTSGARPHRRPRRRRAHHRRGGGARRARGVRPAKTVAENTAAMAEEAQRVSAGEVTQAVRDSTAECGPIKSGDWIAITRDGIVAAVPSALDAAVALLDALVGDDSELVTVLVGEDAHRARRRRARRPSRQGPPRLRGGAPPRRPAALPLPHRGRVAGVAAAPKMPASPSGS